MNCCHLLLLLTLHWVISLLFLIHATNSVGYWKNISPARQYSLEGGAVWAMVPRVGLEPTRLAAPDFESGTSTNSITEAGELSGTKPLRGESVTNTALLSA